MACSTRMLVGAIDFGTTYSGVAMSFAHEYKRDPTKVFAIRIGTPNVSFKCMTCILIKPDGHTFFKFGDFADSYYYENLDEMERKDWFYFKRFKMGLYDVKGSSLKDFELTDESGKTLPALKVFSLSIRYLKDAVLEHCDNQIVGVVNDSDITWVLTVPAIWDDRAKGFMREAAEEAGIKRQQLTIALEPEAASIFCRHIPFVRDQPDIAKLVPFKPGMKYVVLDCGGGTVDITAHEVVNKVGGKENDFHFIRELTKARGNDMGGTKVDQAFLGYLESLTGEDVFQTYEQTYRDDLWELMKSFEEKKRKIEDDDSKMIIGTKLIKVFGKAKGLQLKEHLKENEDVSFPAPEKMRISNKVAKGFFNESITAIIGKLEEMFAQEDVKDCSTILLVGGYSESPLLQQRVKEAFPSKKVLFPRESSLAVLKGAVIFGHNPGAISERISRYTYGTNIQYNGFSKLVGVGERLQVGKSNRVNTYYPASYFQNSVPVDIYVSPKPNPQLLSDEGCVKIMTRAFPLPRSFLRFRYIEVCMVFGGTEFKVKVKNVLTGHEETFYVHSFD